MEGQESIFVVQLLLKLSPFQTGRGEEEFSEITFHGPGHYVLLSQAGKDES